MATSASLNRDSYLINDGNDSKVIIRNLAAIPGGVTLDMSNWTPKELRAGHIIKHNTSTGVYLPLGITGSNNDTYATLEADEEYAGVLVTSILKDKPFAPVMTIGEVNAAASPYPITSTIKAGLPRIEFLY